MIFLKLRKLFAQFFVEMRWYNLLAALFIYATSSWLLLSLAGEGALLNISDFIYWLVVTGSTVGYGDMSPTTAAGKYIVAFYVIPVGLSIFALVVGRIAGWMSFQWQKGVKGMKPLHTSQHILVIGWNGQRTLNLLQLLLREREQSQQQPDIVLCVRADIQNPLPEQIHFVKVNSFNKDEDMDKACLASAAVVVMDNPEDDVTMTTALYCSQRNPQAHQIAYFTDESLASLLHKHCPNVECTPSVAVEMLAKAAFDPGSSLLHFDLLSVNEGQAQFSAVLPESCHLTAGQLFHGLKQQYQATFIGYAPRDESQQIYLNPPLDKPLNGGDKIYYISLTRITHINWENLAQVSAT